MLSCEAPSASLASDESETKTESWDKALLPRLIFDLVQGEKRQEGKVRTSKVARERLRSQGAGPTFKLKPNGGGGGSTVWHGSVKTKEMKRVHRKAHSTTS